jgi:hypothetical protein
MKSFTSIILLLFALAVRGSELEDCKVSCGIQNQVKKDIQNCYKFVCDVSDTVVAGFNADDEPLTKENIANLNEVEESLSLTSELDDQESESKCVKIISTSVCEGFGAGLEIDVKELSKVYNRTINNANQWEQAIIAATAGGEQMMDEWREFATCPQYGGQPIQFARTYNCLTDLFFFSAPCNNKAKVDQVCVSC